MGCSRREPATDVLVAALDSAIRPDNVGPCPGDYEAVPWKRTPRSRESSGWRSQPAVQRVREAAAEIQKVAKKDPDLAATGAVLLLEKVSPALEQVAGTPIEAGERTDLLELLDDRVGTKATLITSQLAVNQWHAWLDDPTVADAILDRIVHRAHRIPLKGPSLRKGEDADQ